MLPCITVFDNTLNDNLTLPLWGTASPWYFSVTPLENKVHSKVRFEAAM